MILGFVTFLQAKVDKKDGGGVEMSKKQVILCFWTKLPVF